MPGSSDHLLRGMRMVCLSNLVKLLSSKAESNLKTYVHLTMLRRFFKIEICLAEVMNLADLICFNTIHILCEVYVVT